MQSNIQKAGTPSAPKIWNACLYVRLSKEDGDKEESDSITNQKALIRDYVCTLSDVKIVAELSDDGFSGASFERPSFVKMMDEIKAGRINCVVVKDAYVKLRINLIFYLIAVKSSIFQTKSICMSGKT